MIIEIVDFPIENGDFPYSYVSLPEGIPYFIIKFLANKPIKIIMKITIKLTIKHYESPVKNYHFYVLKTMS